MLINRQLKGLMFGVNNKYDSVFLFFIILSRKISINIWFKFYKGCGTLLLLLAKFLTWYIICRLYYVWFFILYVAFTHRKLKIKFKQLNYLLPKFISLLIHCSNKSGGMGKNEKMNRKGKSHEFEIVLMSLYCAFLFLFTRRETLISRARARKHKNGQW